VLLFLLFPLLFVSINVFQLLLNVHKWPTLSWPCHTLQNNSECFIKKEVQKHLNGKQLDTATIQLSVLHSYIFFMLPSAAMNRGSTVTVSPFYEYISILIFFMTSNFN